MNIREALKDKLTKFYGEENVGELHLLEKSVDYIAVYFKTLEIQHSASPASHTVTDIFFYFKLTYEEENKKFRLTLGCLRSSISEKEVKLGYIHSHVPKFLDSQEYIYCTGVSPFAVVRDQIADYIYNYEGTLPEFDENVDVLLNSLVLAFDRMIRIESKEGGPYVTLTRLGSLGSNSRDMYYLNDMYRVDLNDRCVEAILALPEVPRECLVNYISLLKWVVSMDNIGSLLEFMTNSDTWSYTIDEFGECAYQNARPYVEFSESLMPKFIFKETMYTLKLNKSEVIESTKLNVIESKIMPEYLVQLRNYLLILDLEKGQYEHKL